MSNRSWGPWRLDLDNMQLVHENDYDIRLSECNTSAGALDWLGQIAGKGWVDAETLGWVVKAMNDLLHLQERLCGQRIPKRMKNVTAVVRFEAERLDFIDANEHKWAEIDTQGFRTVALGTYMAELTRFELDYRRRNKITDELDWENE